MIDRAAYDLVRTGFVWLVKLLPAWLLWWSSKVSYNWWGSYLVTLQSMTPGVARPLSYDTALACWPAASLLGPLAIMAVAVVLHRMQIASMSMALLGIFGLALMTALTVWPELVRVRDLMGQPGGNRLTALNAFSKPYLLTGMGGFFLSFAGYCIASPKVGVGDRHQQKLERARSDNFGHADWLSPKDAHRRFPGPDPVFGGIVVGEAYRVDEDRGAKQPFDPSDLKTWGMGGRAPLLIDPCRDKSTHAMVFAGAGGFKTTSIAIPTLIEWKGSAVILDPSREIGPMMHRYREQELGHQVVTLDPSDAASGFNVLDWIDPASPLAASQLSVVVGWICGESRGPMSSGSEFFRDSSAKLIGCLLADLLWDPALPPDQKTLRTLRARLVTAESDMPELLDRISKTSHSPTARDAASSLKDGHKETFSSIYLTATRDTDWLSIPAYASLVSGSTFRSRDLTGGKLTVFVQIPLGVLRNTPALGRVIVGALLNGVFEADGHLRGRILFLLDEVARLGFMKVLEDARDTGRKYGITLLMLYQSLGQLVEQWGREGKQSWFDSTAWRLFAAVQDPDTAKEVSALCGEYGVVTTSTGDTEGTSSRSGLGASNSAGRSENRGETRRALIRPDEILQDSRADEAFVLIGGMKPLRCGRAIYFRRKEWDGLVGDNRFHRNRDAAE